MCLAGWARSAQIFAIRRPDWSRRQQLASFAFAPIYGGLHLLVLLPLRLWSLLTLRRGGWGPAPAAPRSRPEDDAQSSSYGCPS